MVSLGLSVLKIKLLFLPSPTWTLQEPVEWCPTSFTLHTARSQSSPVKMTAYITVMPKTLP